MSNNNIDDMLVEYERIERLYDDETKWVGMSGYAWDLLDRLNSMADTLHELGWDFYGIPTEGVMADRAGNRN